MSKRTIPAISIIIPMYNTEKYIGECLDSILAQTFDDYEVIVVDDCSKDKSCDIVESYIPKFNDRLQLIRSKINSGGRPGIPRNTGLRLSTGEYIMFIDSDDTITKTAFKELYKTAKRFNADVIHCDKFFRTLDTTVTANKELLKEENWGDIEIVSNNSLLSENVIERLKKFSTYKIFWTTWSNFIRRDFVMKNSLFFPNMAVAEDLVFTVYLLCLAKNFVRTPNTFYIWRKVENSLTNLKASVDKRIKNYAGSIIKGIEILDKFLNTFDTLKNSPEYKYGVFEVLTNSNIIGPTQLLPVYAQIPAYQLDEFVRRELKQVEDKTALTAFLFGRMNLFNVKILQQQNLMRQQQAQIKQLQAQLQQNKNNLSFNNKKNSNWEVYILSNKTIPAISIIIPMYNMEKYIGECLDSILAQTFDDYEVIVVDDCSKDKSCDIVESYIPKFNGRLQLIRSKVNSGGAGTPRNTGLRISRGDYIYLMDSDDAIIETAMEDLYKTALNFDADVLHCEKFYRAPGETVTTNRNLLKIGSFERVEFVKKPTFVSDNPADVINDFTNYRFWNAPWIHFIRRDFIMKNNILFPNIGIGDDIMFNFYIICLTQKILRIPNVYYVWRENKTSNTRAALSVEKYIHRYGNSVMKAIGLIDDFASRIEIFQKYPELKFDMFDFFTRDHLTRVFPHYAQIPAYQLDEFVRRELEQVEDKTALTAFLFGRMNLFNVKILQQQNIIRQQQAQIKQLQAQLQQNKNTFGLNNEDIFKLS